MPFPYYRRYVQAFTRSARSFPRFAQVAAGTLAGSAPWAARYLGKRMYSAYNNRRSAAQPRIYQKPYKSLKKAKNPGGKLTRAVRELQHQVRSNEGELTYRERQVNRVVTDAVNECELAAISGSSVTKLETVIANLKYFDPTAPGTYINVDFTSGTQSKVVRLKMYSKLNVRNNYVVPARVDLYLCTPKIDTALSTLSTITSGYADVGGVDIDSSLMYPTDSPSFVQLWKIVKHSHFVLKPGGERSMNFSKSFFDYNPSLTDIHTDVYQTSAGSHQYLIRVTGVLAHDSAVATEEGFSKAGVDASVVTTYTCRYAAGADIKYIIINDGADVFTNTPNVTQPDTQQESYSV